MYQAMKLPQYPRIEYRLSELTLKETPKSANGPFVFESTGNLVVSGVTNKVSFPVTMTRSDKTMKTTGTTSVKMTSFGITPPALDLAIVDPNTCTRRALGEVGEIWLRGPSVAAGYWGDVESSRERFLARLVGDIGPGFLRTGDLGFCHAGELYVTGRLKDLIIVRGRNIHPQDLEELAQQAHPRVRPGCVAAFGLELEGEERGRHDALAVDRVVAVEVGPGPRLAELVHAERHDPGPEGAPQEAEGVRGAVLHGDDWGAPLIRRDQLAEVAGIRADGALA